MESVKAAKRRRKASSKGVDPFFSALETLGWGVERQVGIPGTELQFDARLRLPESFGGAVLYAEILDYADAATFWRTQQEPLGEPILLATEEVTEGNFDINESYKWEFLRHDSSEVFVTSVRELADVIAKQVGFKEKQKYRSDLVPLHLDHPAREDLLGRRALAESLAKRLRRIIAHDAREFVDTAFMVHVHAPWGAGKTSFLNFLREDLRDTYVIVDFNAWQHQRLSPPWWFLIDAIYLGGLRQTGRWRKPMLWVRENYWRLSVGRGYMVFGAAALLGLLAGTFYYLPSVLNLSDNETIKDANEYLSYGASALALLTAVWGGVRMFSQSLLLGSAGAARSFVDSNRDPMRQLQRHFHQLASWIDQPIVVFIDDIDRCTKTYVVELLEGIQTLLRDPRILYIVAGDRGWLNLCFEVTYQDFIALREPGRRLGGLFLEKAFQLSFALPRLSVEAKQDYWRRLLQVSRSADRRQQTEAEKDARDRFGQAHSQEQVMATLSAAGPDPIRQQAYRAEAIRRMADREIEASTQHFLLEFTNLLEPNPRAMKRLVNAFGIYRDVAILSGIGIVENEEARRQLALWSILSLRWPILEEALAARPDLADSYSSPPPDFDAHLAVLLTNSEVRRLFDGTAPNGTRLNSGTVQMFAQLSSSIAAAE